MPHSSAGQSCGVGNAARPAVPAARHAVPAVASKAPPARCQPRPSTHAASPGTSSASSGAVVAASTLQAGRCREDEHRRRRRGLAAGRGARGRGWASPSPEPGAATVPFGSRHHRAPPAPGFSCPGGRASPRARACWPAAPWQRCQATRYTHAVDAAAAHNPSMLTHAPSLLPGPPEKPPQRSVQAGPQRARQGRKRDQDVASAGQQRLPEEAAPQGVAAAGGAAQHRQTKGFGVKQQACRRWLSRSHRRRPQLGRSRRKALLSGKAPSTEPTQT